MIIIKYRLIKNENISNIIYENNFFNIINILLTEIVYIIAFPIIFWEMKTVVKLLEINFIII